MPHALSLIFSSFSLFLFIFRSLHFSIILHLSLLFSLRHINLFTIDPWVPLYNFHIFSLSLGSTYGFNNHLINIHLKFPENTQVGSIIPGIYNNFYYKNSRVFLGHYIMSLLGLTSCIPYALGHPRILGVSA